MTINFRRLLYVVVLAISFVFFIWGCSKLPGFVGTGFDPREIHKMSAEQMLLIGIYAVGVASLMRR